MSTTPKQRGRHPKRSSLSGKSLTIRKISKKEEKRFKELAGKFHYMGEGHAGGDTLRLVVEADGEWIALFLWGSAAYRLKDRDSYIGWSGPQRAQRQKLIVQNRRFTLLVDRGAHPNLASRILGQMIRELPSLWYERFGYEPLLAETFSDIEAREGTCYKASGWLELGATKGYSRHRADFYVPNDRPKKLWVRELRKDAALLLRAVELPPECAKGSESDADGVMPLNMPQIESLHAALCKVPDPRAGNSVFHIGAMLSIIAMAILNVNFPHVRTVIKVRRKSSAAKNPKGFETSYYVSSISVDSYTPKQWLTLIRGHWGGIESRNHWRKDACLLEDKTRSRNPTIVASLAMLRNLVLFFFNEQQAHSTLTGFVEAVAADPSKAYAMLTARS